MYCRYTFRWCAADFWGRAFLSAIDSKAQIYMRNFRIRRPETVMSPRRHISEVIEIFNGGIDEPFSLAVVCWDGVYRIGIRWNITENEWDDPLKDSGEKECVGEPNSRGYSTWFILPANFINDLLQPNSTLSIQIIEAKRTYNIK